METLWHDLGYGFRMLWKTPGFTIAAVLSLAIGIGANSAIFSVTNALLLRPLPYKDADRLVILWNRSPGLNVAQDWFSPGQYLDVKTENHVFDETAMTIGGSFNLTGQGTPERVDGARVSSSLFPLLGAQAKLGRVFTPDDDRTPGGHPIAVLAYELADQEGPSYVQKFAGAIGTQVERCRDVITRLQAGAAKRASNERTDLTGAVFAAVDAWRAAHRTRSRNMLTCDDSTPPSPCNSATEASRTCRGPARSVICKCVSTRCAIAPPTPQWP